jgi:hypothetical protein
MVKTITKRRKHMADNKNIAAALVKFQSELPKATKDSSADTGKYSYDYASLDKLTEIIFPKLSENGLAYTAAPDLDENGQFGLRARLIHTSGEEIGGFYPLGNPNNPAQAIGSAITYARRYALLALTGVAPADEDDDGASANEAQAKANVAAPASAAKPKDTPESLRAEMGQLIDSSNGLVGADDANKIMAEVTNGKDIASWTVTDLRKGRTKLVELIEERKNG